MVTKVRLDSIDRLRVGHLITWDWQKPGQRVAEVVEERVEHGVRTLTLRDRSGRTVDVTNETVRDLDLSVPENWSPRSTAGHATRLRPAAPQPTTFRARRLPVRAVQFRSDRETVVQILRFIREHAGHLILEPTADRPFEQIAFRDPQTGVLVVLLTTGRLEMLPGEWLVWRDAQLTVVTDEAFRAGYEAE